MRADKMIRNMIYVGSCCVACTSCYAFEWSGNSSTNNGYMMLDSIVIMGGVTTDHCHMGRATAPGLPSGIYASKAGDKNLVKLNADIRHLQPYNCQQAVEMVNAAGIWNTTLFRESAYQLGSVPIPENQVHIRMYQSGPGPYGTYAEIYYSVPPSLSPPKPASCQALQAPSLDFGTIDPNEISGKKATSQVLVWCDKKASVRVRFMTREGLAIFQMDNGLTTYLKIDDNPGTAGSYQTVAENASSPARAFNLSAELLGTSGSVKPGAFSYTAVVRVDIL